MGVLRMDSSVLRSREEMMRRLEQIDSSFYLREHVYPLFVRFAGQQKMLFEVVTMLVRTLREPMRGVPPEVNTFWYKNTERYIAALFQDPSAVEEAKVLLERILSVE